MASTRRKTRTYKEKRSMLAFGHFVLPIAALMALGMLFIGIKLFFLTPPDRGGIEVTLDDSEFAALSRDTNLPAEGQGNPPDETSLPALSANAQTKPLSSATKPAGEKSVVLAGPVDVNASGKQTAASVKTAKENSSTNAAQKGKNPIASNNPGRDAQNTKAKETDKKAVAENPAQKKTDPQSASKQASKWLVQIGAFTKQEGAAALADQAKKEGYTATVSKTDSSGTMYHRVRIAGGSTREEAAKLATELEKKGYPVSLVVAQQ